MSQNQTLVNAAKTAQSSHQDDVQGDERIAVNHSNQAASGGSMGKTTTKTRNRMTTSQRYDLKEKLVRMLAEGYSVQAAGRLLDVRQDAIKPILFDHFAEINENVPRASKYIVGRKQTIGILPGFADYSDFEVTVKNDGTIVIRPVDLETLRKYLGINQ